MEYKYKEDLKKNIFRGYDVRGIYPEELDEDTAYTFGLGFGSHIRKIGKNKSGIIVLFHFLCIFAFATMLGWGLYGIRCAQFLFGERIWKIIILFQVAIITLSTFLKTGTIWKISEILNGEDDPKVEEEIKNKNMKGGYLK